LINAQPVAQDLICTAAPTATSISWRAKTFHKRRLSLSKLTTRTITFLFLLLLISVKQASAQGGSVYFGVGTALDTAGTTTNVNPPCPSGNLYDDLTLACEPGPTIGGAFGLFGVDYMIKPHFGVNGEYAFRFAQAPYLPLAGLNMRPGFYDFNAVWEPNSGSNARIVPVLEGGIGGSTVTLYVNQTSCVTGICGSSSYPAGLNSNHFQVHAAAGVKLYVNGNFFVKPQFDFHYVTNLTDQFGRNWVPQVTVSVGYTFGQR
jgi:hypothetical protein